jgi:mRNA interferase MazF
VNKRYANQIWLRFKLQLEANQVRLIYKEREIWWAALGSNIGYEEDGKSQKFSRPVVIVKGFSEQLIWVVPLSTTTNRGKYYHPLVSVSDKSVALLSQLRTIDTLRLLAKIGMLQETDFVSLKSKLREFLA